MGKSITVRLPDDLAEWLRSAAIRRGVSRAQMVRNHLERARALEERPFLRLAGSVSGPLRLSARIGFSRR